MTWTTPIVAAGPNGGPIFGGGPALVVGVGVGLLVLVAALFAVLLLSRRRLARDIREVVQALEDLRLGQPRARTEADANSPVALVFDAISRLGQDVAARVRTAETRDEQVRAVMAAMSDSAVITTDIDGEIRGFSQGARLLFGWDELQVAARPVAMLFEETSYKEFLPKLARRSLREQGITSHARMVRRDGSDFEADVAVRMLHGSSGDPTGFLIVARDITQQIDLEAQLRESEQRYRSLVEGLAEGVLIVHEGRVLYANPAFGNMCGVEHDRLIGTTLRERIATRDVLLVEECIDRLEEQPGGTAELVCRLIGDDETSERQVRFNASAIYYGGGRAVLLLARDETAERRIVTELRRNESQLDAVLEATSDGILVLLQGRRGRFVKMTNRAFVERFTLAQHQILGRSEEELLELMRAQGRPAAAVASYLERSRGEQGREVLTVGGRGLGDLELTIRPLRTRAGVTVGRVLACRDLTEQRESERRLQLYAEEQQLSKVKLERAYRKLDAANKDLQSRTEQLDRLNSELRKLNEMKSNLLGNVSHELQTPLVSIRGYTEMILKGRLGPVTEEQSKGLSLGLKNIDRLISMIDNLLVFSRSEAELGQLKLEQFSLRPLIEEAVKLLEDKARTRGIRTDVRIAAADLTIHADRDKIQQVFINLLSNAIKFNKPGGSVSIAAREGKPGFAAVVVEDTGVGIPADALGHVFERHYQVSQDPAHSPRGSGIGLAIVQDILRSHGCVIGVDSEEGRGARFNFTLPLAVEEARGERRGERPTPYAERQAEQVPSVEVQKTPPAEAEPSDSDPDLAEKYEGRRPRFRIIRRRS
jgi:PAS domain S-box-containing protein